MRDIALAITIIVLVAYSLRSCYIGFLGWVWFSMMSPHRLTYGFMYSQPAAQIMFIALSFGLLKEKNKGKLFQHGIVVVHFMFVVWMTVTTIFAWFPEESYPQFNKVMKIQLGIFITYLVINSKDKLNGLLWVIYGSIGFYGVKGGIFTLLHGGQERVWGPAGSFIEENNSLAAALLTIMPIGFYLRSLTTNIWIKNALLGSTILLGVSVLGSQSRGAMLGLITLCLFFMRNMPGKQKLVALIITVFFSAMAVMFMPQKWWNRMHSIETYDQDSSAMGRINAWWCAYNLALDHFLGAGFNYYTPFAFSMYAPNPKDVHAAHSIYFQILGDHGFLGLGLFLLIAVWTMLLLGRIIRKTRDSKDYHWANLLARILQSSFIGYFVAGAFLSLAYYDLYWQLITVTVILNTLVNQPITDEVNPQKASAGPDSNLREPFVRAPRNAMTAASIPTSLAPRS